MEFRRGTPGRLSKPVSEQQIADLRLAATQMTGAKRRAFQAEMTEQYCAGNPRQAERRFAGPGPWKWAWLSAAPA